MYDLIPYLDARDRTTSAARSALPDSPVRPDPPRRSRLRHGLSTALYRLASWLEPASASQAPHAGRASPHPPA